MLQGFIEGRQCPAHLAAQYVRMRQVVPFGGKVLLALVERCGIGLKRLVERLKDVQCRARQYDRVFERKLFQRGSGGSAEEAAQPRYRRGGIRARYETNDLVARKLQQRVAQRVGHSAAALAQGQAE